MRYNTGMDDPRSYAEETKSPGGAGPISATIIIVLILLVAGVYFLVQQERHVRAMKAEEEAAQLPVNS